MSINTQVTQRRLIAEIKEWADAHEMINKFGYGDFLQLYQESENLYPYFMVNISTGSETTFYFRYQIEVFVAMWVWDDRTNQLRSESDSELILRDFTNTVRISPRWQQFSRIDSLEMPKRKVIERGGDKVTGWGVTINLSVKKKASICDIEALLPTYDFETQSVLGSRFFVNGVDEDQIVCSENFNLTVVDTNLLEVGTYDDVTKTITVPAAGGGGSFTYDVYANGVDTGQDVLVDGSDITINAN